MNAGRPPFVLCLETDLAECLDYQAPDLRLDHQRPIILVPVPEKTLESTTSQATRDNSEQAGCLFHRQAQETANLIDGDARSGSSAKDRPEAASPNRSVAKM